AAYMNLVDLNLSSALVKYVSEYASRPDRKPVEEVIGTTITLYLILGLLASLIFSTMGYALLPLLHIRETYRAMAWHALLVTALALPFTLLSSTLAMLPATTGRFDITVLAISAVGPLSTVMSIIVALA